jgi:hypothetical protein
MTPNRIVALLTPLVFAPLAGAIAAWVAENLPGVEVSASSLEEIFIAGALIALAPAVQWLHGWQKHEARQATLEQGSLLANPALAPPPPGLEPEPAFEQPDAFEEPLDEDELVDDEDGPLAEVDDEAFADDLDALDDDLDELDDLEAELLDEEETAAAGS